jgi:HK97 family phage major capsid protein
MASRVKELLDELATTLAEMGMLEEQEPETAMAGDEPVTEGERSAVAASEARQARYDELLAKAERIKSAIAKEEARQAKKTELMKVLNRAAPAVEVVEKARIEPVAYRGRLRAFESHEVAHRCGQWLKAHFGDASARQWCRDNLGTEYRDLGGQVQSLGGSLVFQDFSNTIIRPSRDLWGVDVAGPAGHNVI